MIDKIVQLIGLLFFAFAVWLIGKEIEHIGVASLWHLIWSTPLWVILLVLMMMVLDFAVLSGYDKLALDYISFTVSSCVGGICHRFRHQ